jgi:hypothetical protein
MKKTLLAVAALLVAAATPAAAFTKSEIAGLKSMSGVTRLIQACNLQALIQIAADKNKLRPEHVAIDGLSQPNIKGDAVSGKGGVLRSGGKWYQFDFDCKTSPDHLEVTKFGYKLGDSIPKDKWAEYNLYQ